MELLCSCADYAYRFLDSGNTWSATAAFLSFFRHVAKLKLPVYDKWQHYEAATEHGGFRWMHAEFCIVSDRPRVLTIDAMRRPHNDSGPSHLWADGFAIFHWHGYRIPDDKTWLITEKARITAEAIMAEPNAELRRVMCEIVEWRPLLDRAKELDADTDGNGQTRRLLEIRIGNERQRVIDVTNGTVEADGSRRRFVLGTRSDVKTARAAVAASYGLAPERFREAVRT